MLGLVLALLGTASPNAQSFLTLGSFDENQLRSTIRKGCQETPICFEPQYDAARHLWTIYPSADAKLQSKIMASTAARTEADGNTNWYMVEDDVGLSHAYAPRYGLQNDASSSSDYSEYRSRCDTYVTRGGLSVETVCKSGY